MCLSPKNVGGVQYPCGKCPECKSAEAYKYGLRGMLVGSFYSLCCNATLTYRDEVVPWRKYAFYDVSGVFVAHPIGDVVRYSDPFTGEVLCDFLDPSLIVESRVFNGMDSRSIRYIPIDLPEGVGALNVGGSAQLSFDEALDCCGDCPIRKTDYFDFYCFDFTTGKLSVEHRSEDLVDDKCRYLGSAYIQVLYQRDVQLLLKRFRERFFSYFGYRLDMPYIGVSEYGPNTCRPHYHLCSFFDDTSDYDFLVSNFIDEWETHFGHVESKFRLRSSDPAAFSNFARYVAKYGKKIDKARHPLDLYRLLPLSHVFSSTGFKSRCNEFIRSMLLRGRPQASFFTDAGSLYDFYLSALNLSFVIPSSVSDKAGGYSMSSRVCSVPVSLITESLNTSYYVPCTKLVEGEVFNYYRKVVIRSALSRSLSFVSRFGGLDLLARISSSCPGEDWRRWPVDRYLRAIVKEAKASAPRFFDECDLLRSEVDYLSSFKSLF